MQRKRARIYGVAQAILPNDQFIVGKAILQGRGIQKRIEEHRNEFCLLLPDGFRVRILSNHSELSLLIPTRKLCGRWKSLRSDPLAFPFLANAPEKTAKASLSGKIICEGDQIRVTGQILDETFAHGTGGPREAAARRVTVLLAETISHYPDSFLSSPPQTLFEELFYRFYPWKKIQ